MAGRRTQQQSPLPEALTNPQAQEGDRIEQGIERDPVLEADKDLEAAMIAAGLSLPNDEILDAEIIHDAPGIPQAPEQPRLPLDIKFSEPSGAVAPRTDDPIDILRRMLVIVSVRLGSGRFAPGYCAHCEQTGVHSTPFRRCPCPCHDAREYLKQLDAAAAA